MSRLSARGATRIDHSARSVFLLVRRGGRSHDAPRTGGAPLAVPFGIHRRLGVGTQPSSPTSRASTGIAGLMRCGGAGPGLRRGPIA